MTYKIFIRRKAQKQLESLPSSEYLKIKQTILGLSYDPKPHNALKLKDREGWRVRVGDYRIIYEIEDDVLIVIVIKIGHRKDIYRT